MRQYKTRDDFKFRTVKCLKAHFIQNLSNILVINYYRQIVIQFKPLLSMSLLFIRKQTIIIILDEFHRRHSKRK